jgi:hypothetical protein
MQGLGSKVVAGDMECTLPGVATVPRFSLPFVSIGNFSVEQDLHVQLTCNFKL